GLHDKCVLPENFVENMEKIIKKNQDTLKYKSPSGHGEIIIKMPSGTSTKPSFSTLQASYPLKFLSPKTYTPYLAAIYILTYGGGMVSGDKIFINIECHENVNLMLLTQGSTKIYKKRQISDQFNNNNDNGLETTQNLNVIVQKNSFVLQLPEPTTCFYDSEFVQHQKYSLENHTSSVIILDWFTSGRMSRGERWEFLKYESGIDLFVNNKLIFRDVVLLKRKFDDYISRSSTPKEDILYGPKVTLLINNIVEEFDKIVVGKASKMPDLIWSSSGLDTKQHNDGEISDLKGLVLKVAGVTTEIVKNFLIEVALKDLDELVGDNLFKRAL
ncbi:1942_t:CDS:2, partial [Entrophospora sp. SA101]